ncbi:hypothetical protein KAU13_05560 [candidate division WOR-3 bacterium]|nr:hypothetical protein [candidate division WOR-3 bacterium]
MVEKTRRERNRERFCRLAMITLAMLVGLISNANDLFAQELSEEVKMTAMIQYTMEYRFGKDLKVGDWVKYQMIEEGTKTGEIELKVTKQEKGGVWIVEEFPGMKIHLLVDLKRMKVLKGFGIDDEGEKREATLLDDKELAEVIAMFKNQMEQEGVYSQVISWKKGEETEKVDVPAGSFTCSYLEPEYSEQHKKQIEDYIKLLREHGKSDAEIEEVKKSGRLYFSKDVPRLLPMQIAIGWMPWIDIFKEVKVGLVECRHMSPLRLTAYSGQKE